MVMSVFRQFRREESFYGSARLGQQRHLDSGSRAKMTDPLERIEFCDARSLSGLDFGPSS